MESHLTTRPNKTPFAIEEQIRLRNLAVQKVQVLFLPNEHIQKIILIGSSIKGTFGKYEEPGFRGSLYSDFDFIVFVDSKYQIPEWLEHEPDGKPFIEEQMNLAYRAQQFIEDKHDAEIFFLNINHLHKQTVLHEAEAAGIPVVSNSQHPHMIVYSNL